MITEDYVSFEVAKLLKEKGFDEPCYSSYKKGVFSLDSYMMTNVEFNNNAVSAPTLQMTLKWLREVHNIFIKIDYVVLAKGFFEYSYEIHNMRKGGSVAISAFRDDYETYEEAIEAAIKYCLTNLI